MYQRFTNVYFIEAVGLDMVKIGRTNNVEQRLRTLEGMCPVPVKLLAIMSGIEQDAERWIQSLFREQRDHGEWYHLNEELREFIKRPTAEALQEFIKDEDRQQLPHYLLELEDGDYEFQFGKHRAERLTDVLAENPGYIDWMARKGHFPLSVKEVLLRAVESPTTE